MKRDLPASTVRLNDTQVERIAQALAGPRRYEILRDIGAANGPCACTALLEAHDITAATLSHHLRELERAELISYQRDGKFKSVTIRRDVLQAYAQRLGKI
jgi:ArsR family transcriptional regulator